MLRGKTAYSHRILKILLNKCREVYPWWQQKCSWMQRASDRLKKFQKIPKDSQFQKIPKSIDTTKLVLTWPRPVRTNCRKTTLIKFCFAYKPEYWKTKRNQVLICLQASWQGSADSGTLMDGTGPGWQLTSVCELHYWPCWSHDDFHQLLKQLPSTTCLVSKNGTVKCTPWCNFQYDVLQTESYNRKYSPILYTSDYYTE